MFAAALGLVLVYALRGGSYDIVVRQEHGLVIWWVLAVGIALGLLPRAGLPGPTLLLLGALVAYAAWTALSLTWTESSERTTAELARVLDYIGLIALVASVLGRRTWRAAAAGVGIGALLVCVLAIASRLAPSAFPIDLAARVFRADRLDYPFGYWNAVGAWGAMSAAFGLAWSAHDRSRLRRAAVLSLVPVACLTTYLTYSRAGIGAIALAVLAVLALSRNRLTALIHTAVAAAGAALAILAVRGAPQIARATGTRGSSSVLAALIFAAALCAGVALLTQAVKADRLRMPRALSRGVAVAIAVPLLLAAGIFGPHLASKAWHSFRHTTDTHSANPTARLTNLSGTRYNLWRVALDGFDARPVGGAGAGTYQFWWNRNQRDPESVRNAHSVWLENMAELGAPGLLLILGAMLSAIALAVMVRRRSRRSASAGASAALLAMLFVYLLTASVDWMWQSTAVTVLALGGVATLSARLGDRHIRLRLPVRAALVVAALCAGAIQVPGLLATTEIRRSQSAEGAGDIAQALAWAREAVSTEPWAASAYEQRGLVLESKGDLVAAAADLKRAISHESTNFLHWLILARIETERGRYNAALLDYAQAHRLGRQAPVFQLPASLGLL